MATIHTDRGMSVNAVSKSDVPVTPPSMNPTGNKNPRSPIVAEVTPAASNTLSYTMVAVRERFIRHSTEVAIPQRYSNQRYRNFRHVVQRSIPAMPIAALASA